MKIISEEDNIVMILPTSPFRSKETIIKTCELIKKMNQQLLESIKLQRVLYSYRKIDSKNKGL